MEQFIEFLTTRPLLSSAWFLAFVALIIAQIRHMQVGVKAVVPQEVTHMINREDALVIDMRAIADFNKGHIANSKNIPQSKLEGSHSTLEKHQNKPIIVVCNNGIQAGPAANKLKKAGFEKVYKLAGGYQSWVGENLPVVKG